MRPFLITGSGRCGTTWCQQTLQACGLQVGHQTVFRHEHTLGAPWDWQGLDGDVSYEAVPLLDQIDAVKVLVVRAPLAVARSWIELGAFADDHAERFVAWWQVLADRFPAVLAQPDPASRAVKFWSQWNLAALDHVQSHARIEHLDAHTLCRLVERPSAWRPGVRVPRDVNSRAGDKIRAADVDWQTIPTATAVEAWALARGLGYRTDDLW